MYDDGTQTMIKNLKDMDESIPSELQPPAINGLALKAVLLISGMQTQWNYVSTGMGAIKKGLDYQALEVVARVTGTKLTKVLFRIICDLERTILTIEGDKSGN